jgi:hypothetical protein
MERRKKPRGNQSLDLPTVSQSVRRAIAACAFRFLRRPEAQAVFFRRRHQPRSPTLAKIRPGNPAPAMGPGTTFDIAPNKPSISPLIPSVKKRVSGSPLNALARKRNALGRPRVSVRSRRSAASRTGPRNVFQLKAGKSMKHPTPSDFIVKVNESYVNVIFKPTDSDYNFGRLADPEDIARYGPLSRSPNVRHGNTGDTGDYPAEEVAQMAHSLAVKAVTSP